MKVLTRIEENGCVWQFYYDVPYLRLCVNKGFLILINSFYTNYVAAAAELV